MALVPGDAPSGPGLYLPKYLSARGRQLVNRPEWVGSLVGHNYHGGPQLAGHRVLVIKPRHGHPYRPDEHVIDLGPNDPLAPQVYLPGCGEHEVEELRDLVLALQEKERRNGWFQKQRDLRNARGDIGARVRDYADWLIRQRSGKHTTGPTKRVQEAQP